ncbi:MAG: response regulator transcription factor [Bacteroidaceae bacterium]|nr:response regulator transcription factor [Bacteroidaceae bacterium]MBQ8543203.1 response regulator transcription factor [Bacteroidaceae bacterium]
MNRTAKYKILLIEPSEIVAAGITAIIARNPEFAITQTLSNPGFYNPQSSNIDIIIINPAVIDYNERLDIRSYFGKENITIIALTQGSYEESVLRQYDGCIGIYDSAQRVIQKIKNAIEEATQAPKSDINELSTRERDILRAVAKGKTNKEIADEFNISIYTVISHRRNISQKLGINSIPGLTVYAIMNKLVDMSDFG